MKKRIPDIDPVSGRTYIPLMSKMTSQEQNETKACEIDRLRVDLAKAKARKDAWMAGYCEERIRVLSSK